MVHRTQTVHIQIHSRIQGWLDSLLSYQKKLNDILDSSKKEETKMRAIIALQSIELDIFNYGGLVKPVNVGKFPFLFLPPYFI